MMMIALLLLLSSRRVEARSSRQRELAMRHYRKIAILMVISLQNIILLQ